VKKSSPQRSTKTVITVDIVRRSLQLLLFRGVYGVRTRNIKDERVGDNHRFMSLSRRPVLIAMMVYSVAYGAATIAVWRETAGTSNHRACEKHYLAQSSAESVGSSETRGLRISG
jgi:hypothetical protein